MNDDKEIFELNGVSFAYLQEPVLKDVSLKICRGEKLSILGANGSGKTTLLRILSGLAFPQKGTFSAFGNAVTKRSMDDDRTATAFHRKIGFIFQDSDAQLFCTSLREEIAFGPLQTGMSGAQAAKRVEDVARLLGIEPLLDKAPFHLSGGEKKKAAIAAVLALSPEVLILDEPTNGLDPRTMRFLVDLLLTLNRAGKTLITSTHNLELVQELSDRAVLFNEDHTVAADAPTAQVLADTGLLRRVNLVDGHYRGL